MLFLRWVHDEEGGLLGGFGLVAVNVISARDVYLLLPQYSVCTNNNMAASRTRTFPATARRRPTTQQQLYLL